MVGSFLGGNTRVHGLHYLLEDAFTTTPDGPRLSATFLEQVHGIVSRASQPLYALMHESIYCQGSASSWSAQRVLEEYPQFRDDADEPLLTGEMVYPWYFEEDPALRPLRAAADILAEKEDWGRLYDIDVLAANTVLRRPWCTATTSTWIGTCHSRRRPPSGASRCGRRTSSTTTASRMTARRSSSACSR